MNYTKNIIRLYRQATQIEKEEGRAWYPEALRRCEQLASRYGQPIETVVGVVAALSPRCRWKDNLIDAERLLVDRRLPVKTFGRNKSVALAILDGVATPEESLGQKTLAFFHAIMGNEDSICIDGHMYCVCVGRRLPLAAVPSIAKTAYQFMTDCFLKSAEKLGGISGRDLQAVCWVVWRNLHHV